MQAAISFHNLRHPAERAEAQINAFLTHVAVKEKCPQLVENPKAPYTVNKANLRILCRSV